MSRPKALAVCTTALGDLLFCLPAIEALGQKFSVDVLCHVKRAPLLWGNPHISRLYTYRNNGFKRFAAGLQLISTCYQRVAILHANDDVKKLLRWLRYEKAFNIQDWREQRLRLDALPRNSAMHALDRPLMVAEACGADMPLLAERKPRIYLYDNELEQALARWRPPSAGARPLLGLVPGASRQDKRWPLDNFINLGLDLKKRGVDLLLIGSKNEAALLNALKAALPEARPAFNLPLRELTACIASLTALITNDTGPLHLAHAMNIPSVSLFGPTDPATIAPRAHNHLILSAGSHSADGSYLPAPVSGISLAKAQTAVSAILEQII